MLIVVLLTLSSWLWILYNKKNRSVLYAYKHLASTPCSEKEETVHVVPVYLLDCSSYQRRILKEVNQNEMLHQKQYGAFHSSCNFTYKISKGLQLMSRNDSCLIYQFLAALAKLRASSYSFRPSIRPCGKTRLPLDVFWLNVMFQLFFRKFVEKVELSLKPDRNNGYFTWRSFHIYDNMRNALDKRCRENQNTHFVFNNSFPKVMPFMRQCRVVEPERP